MCSCQNDCFLSQISKSTPLYQYVHTNRQGYACTDRDLWPVKPNSFLCDPYIHFILFFRTMTRLRNSTWLDFNYCSVLIHLKLCVYNFLAPKKSIFLKMAINVYRLILGSNEQTKTLITLEVLVDQGRGYLLSMWILMKYLGEMEQNISLRLSGILRIPACCKDFSNA